MTDFILNKDQQIAANAAIDWFYNSSEQLFQIDGEAGTGKSVVINSIVKRLGLNRKEILPMAFTGQAAIVMRGKGLTNATTLHSGLFDPIEVPILDDFGNPIIDKQFNIPLKKWEFIPKDFSNTDIKLIIIDEAWTAPFRFRKDIFNTGIKILAAGDSGQLPPVKDKPAFLIDGKIYHLTEYMRQSENSPLLYIAHKLRRQESIDYGLYGNSVLVISDEDLNNDILSRGDIILCAKNSTRDNLNTNIRKNILRIDSKYPLYGEKIICRKNNWHENVGDISLANGLRGSMMSTVDASSYNSKTKCITVNFLPDMLSMPFFNLDINYQYLKSDYKERARLKAFPYTRGELFEYAYASTVYLSQGSEYNTGIYVEEYINPQSFFLQNYTAVTRFRQGMIYVKHTPRFWNM